MNKADVLDHILGHSCSNPSDKHEGYNVYKFEGHCIGHKIHARIVEDFNEETNLFRYEVVEVEDFDC